MKRICWALIVVLLLLSVCACSADDKTDTAVCPYHGISHQAVFNKKLSDSFFLNDKNILPVDAEAYSYYDLTSLPDAAFLTDNWLVCEDGSVYRLDVAEHFKKDYCSSLYQLHWDELSSDCRIELYATDTVLKQEVLSGRILCKVKNGQIQAYMFIENADYSEYVELVKSEGTLYTGDFYPQIGELHLVKVSPFESNEAVVNKISEEDGILFIRHQILPSEGYWSMTGIYVFTKNGKMHTVYNGKIMETADDIIDISFKYGNSAAVKKDFTVYSERTNDADSWNGIIKVVVAEYLHNMIGLTCEGKVICCDSNAYISEISAWENVADIALLYYDEAFYPIALTSDGSFLLTSDNPFFAELSDITSVSEFKVRESTAESFDIVVLYENGETEIFK